MQIGDKLRKTIENSGLSANALAQEAGLSQSTISRLVRGHDVKLSVAEKLAEYFDLELAEATKPTKPAKRKK